MNKTLYYLKMPKNNYNIEKYAVPNYSPLKCCDVSPLLNKVCLVICKNHVFGLLQFI